MIKIITILLIGSALFGCAEYEDPASLSPSSNNIASPATRSAAVVEYDTLPNPYALDVMQFAYDSITGGGVTLQPTDLYVRFKPANGAQLAALMDYGLELFDYPMEVIPHTLNNVS